jgi:hypothetical protein
MRTLAASGPVVRVQSVCLMLKAMHLTSKWPQSMLLIRPVTKRVALTTFAMPLRRAAVN